MAKLKRNGQASAEIAGLTPENTPQGFFRPKIDRGFLEAKRVGGFLEAKRVGGFLEAKRVGEFLDENPKPKTQEKNKMSDQQKTMAEYKADSRRALAARGGKRIEVPLEAGSVAALAEMRERLGLVSDKQAIAAALEFWMRHNLKPSRETTHRLTA
jgi:hypothetical protein